MDRGKGLREHDPYKSGHLPHTSHPTGPKVLMAGSTAQWEC